MPAVGGRPAGCSATPGDCSLHTRSPWAAWAGGTHPGTPTGQICQKTRKRGQERGGGGGGGGSSNMRMFAQPLHRVINSQHRDFLACIRWTSLAEGQCMERGTQNRRDSCNYFGAVYELSVFDGNLPWSIQTCSWETRGCKQGV